MGIRNFFLMPAETVIAFNYVEINVVMQTEYRDGSSFAKINKICSYKVCIHCVIDLNGRKMFVVHLHESICENFKSLPSFGKAHI